MKKVKARWVIKLSEEKGEALVKVGSVVKRGEMVIKAETKTPISGQVVEVTAEKIVIEFRAFEVEGRGVTAKKAWGEGLLEVNKLTEITREIKGKVLYIREIDGAMILKAEVVGAVAIITVSNIEEYETRMPIVSLEKAAVMDLLAMENIGNRQLLVNANAGRVLVV